MPSIKQATETAILIRASLLSGLCSIVPVPFLDDILLARVRKGVVQRKLRVHEVDLPVKRLKPVYAGPSRGCLARSIGLVFTVVKKVLRKLLRTVFFFLAIRSAALEMVETFLIGRIVGRCLDRHLFRDDESLELRAENVRTAFDQALKGSDRRVLAQAMRQGWKAIGGMKPLARSLAGRFRKGDAEDPIQPEDLSEDEQLAVERGEKVVEEQVMDEEVQRFLMHFDVRFDRAFEALAQESQQG